MKKSILAITLMATLGITSFVACNKKTVETSQDTTTMPKASKMTDPVQNDAAANTNNPYDNVGYQHNVALQSTRTTWTSSTATAQDNFNAVAAYCTSIGSPVATNYPTTANLVERIYADNTPGKTTYIGTIGLSPQGQAYAAQLFTIAGQIDNYESYEAFKAAVVQVENNIMTSSQINSTDRQRLLTGASVERHSVLYWLREEGGYNTDPGTSGNPNGPVALSLFGSIRKWLKDHPIFTADLGGGIGGAAGGVVGALCGAAGASLVEWASQ